MRDKPTHFQRTSKARLIIGCILGGCLAVLLVHFNVTFFQALLSILTIIGFYLNIDSSHKSTFESHYSMTHVRYCFALAPFSFAILVGVTSSSFIIAFVALIAGITLNILTGNLIRNYFEINCPINKGESAIYISLFFRGREISLLEQETDTV